MSPGNVLLQQRPVGIWHAQNKGTQCIEDNIDVGTTEQEAGKMGVSDYAEDNEITQWGTNQAKRRWGACNLW
jgi:hypothetical protein